MAVKHFGGKYTISNPQSGEALHESSHGSRQQFFEVQVSLVPFFKLYMYI